VLHSLSRAVRLAVIAAAASALCVLGAAGAASAAPAAHHSAGHRPLIKGVYLTPHFAAHGTPAVTVPRSHAVHNQQTEPLLYHGGPTQVDPQVYVLYWGLWWSSTCAGQQGNGGTDEGYLASFYQGLGTTSDLQSPVDSQYYGPAGSYPTFPTVAGQEFITENVACSNPPASATDAQLAAEADSYASFLAGQGHSINNNTQIVVVSPSGTNPGGGFGAQYCAYHNWTTYSSSQLLSWTNLPYMPDQGSTCGASLVNGPEDGWSIVGGHENNESVTDPFVNNQSAWYDASGNEIGDKCAWTNLYSETMSTGSFAMQPEWDNKTESCQASATFTNGKITLNGHATLCVQDSTTAGALAKLHSPCSASAQNPGHWVKYPDGSLRRFNSTGACLTPNGSNQLVVERCTNATNQHWSYSGTTHRWTNGDGKCMKAASATSGAALSQATCSATAATQKFSNV
jgi:Ricin-type beta-trefoil lectin domain